MSANQSDLADASYGYDFVVATTQESINGTMKQYLYNTTFPVVQMYWNQDSAGNPVAVARDTLLTQTNGTDPLTVASWSDTEPMTPEIQNINSSNFYFAFQASIGIPPALAPQSIPDIITLQPASQSVIFNLICAEFTVVTCTFGRHGLTGFQNVSQPADTPWLFTSIVALKAVFDATNLPAAVLAQLNNLGADAFSVQQLFFDLDNAALESTPAISGVEPGSPACTVLEQVFLGAYFQAMRTSQQPVLNYSIVRTASTPPGPSALDLTSLQLAVSLYTPAGATTNGLNTLNYLCQVNGNAPPPPVPFTWNWVEASEASACDGVMSINRNTFARYLESRLTGLVSANCYAPSVQVTQSGFLDGTTTYNASAEALQAPAVSTPASGADVLSYSYSASSSDQAGLDGVAGAMTLSTTYSATVSFSGNTIVITQQLVFSIYVRTAATSENWNAIDQTITDTYTLAIGQYGTLTSSLSSTRTDQSQPTPSTNWLVNLITNLNDIVTDIGQWVDSFTSTSFHDLPADLAQTFIFPGGNTFTFKDVSFSENQDLVSRISYVQASQ